MKTKHATSHRLSDEAKSLVETLAQQLGVSRTAILELAIREKAKRDLPRGGKPGNGKETVHA